METFHKKLGARVRALRDDVKLSQEELAERLKISRVSLSQIENGERKITAEEITELAKIFNVASDVLLDLEGDVAVILEKRLGESHKPKHELRINVPQKNSEKFKEVLLYILNKVGSKPNIGQSVIYKLLYFVDFNFYERYEEQLIGATYIKNHHGPTPKEFIKIVEEMEKNKDLVKVQDKYFQYPQTKYLPLRKPDLAKLNDARAIEIIDDVLNRLSDMNAVQIRDYSHKDVPWLTTENGKAIEYESVFYRTPEYSARPYNEEDLQ